MPDARGIVQVIEDDLHIRGTLRMVLELEGYRVRAAANGREALEQLREVPADVILLDLMMPVMTGWEFLAARNADSRLRNVPVIVLSAGGQVAASDLAQAVLRKPVELDELLAAVSLWLRPSRESRARPELPPQP
jgi:CheY-like chemotaxis protein